MKYDTGKADITKRKSEARSFRTKQEALWMELDYMIDGQHYVSYDKVSNQVKIMPEAKRKGSVRRSVNLIRAKLRSVANMINKNEPAFNVRPTYKPNMEPQEVEKAKHDATVCQFLMSSIYRTTNMRQQFKRAVRIGVKRGIAIGQITWSDDIDDVLFEVLDIFDVLIDPICNGDIQKARYIIKSVLVSKESLLNNPDYDQEVLKTVESTSKMSESTYRNSYLQSKYGSESDEDRLILDEKWEKVVIDDPEEEEGKKTQIKVCSYVGELKIGERIHDYEKYPFVSYYPEEVDGELYPRPYFADVVTLNKSIDAIYSFVEEYIGAVGQGRYLVHEKSNLVTQTTGNHGQFLKWSGDRPPTPMDIPRIPYDVIAGHLNNTERFMAEIGGMQFIDVEKITSAGTSGKAIQQLQAQQSESVGEPTDNLSYFAQQVFEFILEIIAKNYTEARTVPHPDTQNSEIYKVRGQAGLSENHPVAPDETIINEVPSFKVTIIPGSAFSDLQLRADMTELYQMQLVDKTTVLDAYKMGSTKEILDKMEDEQKAAAEAQAKVQAQQGKIQNELARQKDLTQIHDLQSIQGQGTPPEGGRGVPPEFQAMMGQGQPAPMDQGMMPPTG